MTRYVIFNADDFGASTGINRAIIDCHVRGVVTSTSFMVTGRAVDGAVAMGRDHPGLSIGLHWDVVGEDTIQFDFFDVAAAREELRRQLGEFHRLFGRLPSHIDSHGHIHRKEHLFPIFQEEIGPLGLPMRGDGRVNFIGGFYAQWEWLVTDLKYVSVPFLQELLRNEVKDGWNEVSCHPGYRSPDFHSVYLDERAAEVVTLTDPAIKRCVGELGHRLANYADMPTPSRADV
jgi:predicted glycoside hydrolase/deacetylase ChbG (UPF0249 family)